MGEVMRAPGEAVGRAARTAHAGVFDRALQIFGVFTADEYALTAVQLSQRTGIALSSLHRLLASMCQQGVLVRVPGRRYAVGPRLWELGERSPLSVRLREPAAPLLTKLYEATGENVHLGVLDGADPATAEVLYVGRIAGVQASATVLRAGGRGPLHATGVGKALLAGRDAVWLGRYFVGVRERETVHTLTDEAALRRDFVGTRSRGFAVAHEEMTLGSVAVAVALPAVAGLPPIAVGVVARSGGADVTGLGELVRHTARELAETIRAT